MGGNVMREFSYKLSNKYDLAAKPALDLVKLASEHDCKTYFIKDNQKADINRLFILLSLGVKSGDTIKFITDGVDENAAIDKIGHYVSRNM